MMRLAHTAALAPTGAAGTFARSILVGLPAVTIGPLIVAALSMAVPHSASAQPPTDPVIIERVGRFGPGGPARALAVEGDVAYVGLGRDLDVVDLADPRRPRMIGGYEAGGAIGAVAVAGDRGYVASDDGRFVVLDLAARDDPRPIGEADIGVAGVRTMVVRHRHAYLAGEGAGLVVVDVARPESPRRVGALTLAGPAMDVAALGGSYVAVAAGNAGLRVVDVADPGRPQAVGSWDGGMSVVGVGVAGGFAFAVAMESYLPGIGRDWMIGGRPNSLELGWRTFETRPGSVVAGLRTAAAKPPAPIRCLLVAFDVADPRRPRPVAQARVGTDTTDHAIGIAVAGGRAHVLASDYVPASVTGFVQVFDITNPAEPRSVGTARRRHAGTKVAALGGLTLVGWERGAEVIDVVGQVAYGEHMRPYGSDPLVALGDHVWLAYRESHDIYYALDRLVGVDVRDVTRPRITGVVPIGNAHQPYSNPGAAIALAARGTHVYAAGSPHGLVTFDVADPAQPRPVGQVALAGRVGPLTMVGHHIYIATGQDQPAAAGLAVVDVADPATPRVVGTLDLGIAAADLAAAGDRVYVVGTTTLVVIDASRPDQPRRAGSLGFAGDALPLQVAARDHLAWVADHAGGLRAVDAADPDRPREIARLDPARPTAGARQLLLLDPRTLARVDAWSVRMFDVAEPARPVEVAAWADPRGALWGATAGDRGHLYVGSADEGVLVLRWGAAPDVRTPAGPGTPVPTPSTSPTPIVATGRPLSWRVWLPWAGG